MCIDASLANKHPTVCKKCIHLRQYIVSFINIAIIDIASISLPTFLYINICSNIVFFVYIDEFAVKY